MQITYSVLGQSMCCEHRKSMDDIIFLRESFVLYSTCIPYVVVYCCSTAGHTDTVWGAFSMYNITKQAVTALTEGLRQELRGIKSNIKITVSHMRHLAVAVYL